MNALGHEARLVQNPALGAVLLWRFARSFSDADRLHAPAPLPVAALILPMVWHGDTLGHISSTQKGSGLRAFANKSNAEFSVLLALHGRAIAWRGKTRAALLIGFGTGILRLNPEAGLIASDAPWTPTAQTHAVRTQAAAAEKIGAWFAALTLREISLILHTRF